MQRARTLLHAAFCTRQVTMVTGPLIILSGPSGSGKSTVIRALRERCNLPLRLSVSATTRPPRPGERDGVEYYFWTPERFEQERLAGGFLEWAEVYGRHYGTLRREVEPYRQQGIGVILDIDVKGAANVRSLFRGDHVSVFLRTGSLDAYEERLRRRGTESEEAIARRLARAEQELTCARDYDYQIINDDLEQAVAELDAIVRRQFERGSHAR